MLIPHLERQQFLSAERQENLARGNVERCDRGFNIPAYWDEAEALDVDVYQGGAMTASAHGHHGDPADPQPSGDVDADDVVADPTGGRGSAELDQLVSLTSLAGTGESAAGRLVAELGNVDDAT